VEGDPRWSGCARSELGRTNPPPAPLQGQGPHLVLPILKQRAGNDAFVVALFALMMGFPAATSAPPAPRSTDTSKTTLLRHPGQRRSSCPRTIAPASPHLPSDQSPVNAAISSLVLPSSFRRCRIRVATGSRWELDPTLLAGRGDQREPVHRHLQDPPEASGRTTPRSARTTSGICGAEVSHPGVVDPAVMT